MDRKLGRIQAPPAVRPGRTELARSRRTLARGAAMVLLLSLAVAMATGSGGFADLAPDLMVPTPAPAPGVP
jgi:hypothetical protein